MLKTKLWEDLTKNLKDRNNLTVSVLRLLLAAILNKEKEKRYKLFKEKPESVEDYLREKSELTDEEVIEVISSEVKKRREAILGYEKGNREDLADKERSEMEILQRYLPEQLSEDEIKNLAQEVIEKLGAKEIKSMGKVMAELMPMVRGKADGGQVSKIVKEILTSR